FRRQRPLPAQVFERPLQFFLKIFKHKSIRPAAIKIWMLPAAFLFYQPSVAPNPRYHLSTRISSAGGTTMYFEQFYLGCLAHASYMLGSEGEAAIVDPQRDVEIYLQAAHQRGLKITQIFKTPLHPDFFSAHVELARRTGANIYISEKADAAFPHEALHEGSQIKLGKVRVTALETPGHTPESMCLVI